MTTMASLLKRKKLETPYRSYRKILYKVLAFLKKNKREEDFKFFTYGYIPARNMDCTIVDYLIKLEQSSNISMNDLQLPYDFLINFDDPDSSQILSAIREFQRRLDILQIISNSGDGSIFEPEVEIKKFKVSKELDDLLKRWEIEMDGAAQNMSKFVIEKVYSEATQRIAKQVALENKHGEALVIAEFLTSVEEMAFNVTDN
ncbi:uncharacterized protein LOC114527578 [Dendronephthya gigantea]|uniref:uncharacterized protein LOC114527578 n=1 Tax=Dendronephthya gigantea TaxID=151771 RepID=UPI00106BBA7B|nr:uncharacterized protein LOC114527578 [Dendronephthya gigantea]